MDWERLGQTDCFKFTFFILYIVILHNFHFAKKMKTCTENTCKRFAKSFVKSVRHRLQVQVSCGVPATDLEVRFQKKPKNRPLKRPGCSAGWKTRETNGWKSKNSG